MQLLLQKGQSMVFLGSRQWTKAGSTNTLTFAKLGDPVKFLNHEFIVDTNKINLNLPLNSPVDVVFNLDTYNNRSVVQIDSITPKA